MSVSSSGCEEDVMRIKKRLEKMMKSNEVSVPTSMDMLNSLKTLPIDLTVLKNTGIGVVLNNLRKSCNSEELGSLAKGLLKNWKKLVANETQQQQNAAASSPNSNSNDSRPPTSPVNNSLSSPSVTNGNPLKRSLSGSPDTERPSAKMINTNNNNSKSDEKSTNGTSNSGSSSITNGIRPLSQPKMNPYHRTISFTETRDPIRLKCREMLANALELTEAIENGTALCSVTELAARCEDIIFAEFKNTDTKYKNRIRSRVINLKDSKNPKLRESVRLGIISPDRLAIMSSDEMASDELKELRAKFTKEAIDDHQMARTQGAKTSLLTCSKCKKNNIQYSEMQTRSADEPMTTFAYCMDCGHRWKFG